MMKLGRTAASSSASSLSLSSSSFCFCRLLAVVPVVSHQHCYYRPLAQRQARLLVLVQPWQSFVSTRRRISSSSSSSSSNSMANNVPDEYGDDSFLQDVDVDALTKGNTNSNIDNINNDIVVAPPQSSQPPPAKRVKLFSANNSMTIAEYGDDSIWDDFDVDALMSPQHPPQLPQPAQQQQQQPPQPQPQEQQQQPQQESANHKQQIAWTSESLHDCLERYFGFRKFKPGQEEAIRAILEGRDVAIFWATGSGKSMAFTLPPLLLMMLASKSKNPTTTTKTTTTALIVSPLISLMQDQVHKLNGLSVVSSTTTAAGDTTNTNTEPPQLATFLGTGQLDLTMERRALQGEFRLVFCTPEKLQSNGFLDGISKLDLCLVAIDESHCVSDWGHDFRPDYRNAGTALRSHPRLRQVPLMALTATAVPRTQADIIQTLQMRDNVLVSKQSFDRTNLAIRILPRDSVRSTMEPLVQTLVKEEKSKAPVASTIIYASTKAQVEEIASFLQQRLLASQSKVQVEYYHGDLETSQRHDTHLAFLTGRTAVVVATIAFGMGIDKPDTRRVIHFGPPKTVEEYYQHIGRAGRDGLPAECTLYVAASDFDKYHSPFYLDNLNGPAREASLASTAALKKIAMNNDICRRKALLDHFEEESTFGDHCGTCDVCLSKKQHGDDFSRDFGPVARLVLEAVRGLREQGISTLLQVLGGKVVEGHRYSNNYSPEALKDKLGAQRAKLPHKVTQDQLKQFVTALTQVNYLAEKTMRSDAGGYCRTWVVFYLTPLGTSALANTDLPIVLPVPEYVREAERQAKAHQQRILEHLQGHGIALDKLPQKEIEDGDGEVIRAYLTWNRRLESLRKSENHERLSQVEELVQLLEEWRLDAASKLQMAPASVLAEHVLYSVAYTAQSLPVGMKLTLQDLEQAGARNREIQSLADVISSWLDRYQHYHHQHDSSASTTGTDPVILLPRGLATAPNGKWEFSVYKPNKKTGLASWESSYIRFTNGESPTSIAMSPETGRPLAVSTVLGHIQEAFLQGRPVDLHLLGTYATTSLPTKSQWVRLQEAESETEMNVAGDPTISGLQGGKYSMTDLLRPIMGTEFAEKTHDQRTIEEQQLFGRWCETLKWYQLLRRGGITPSFESPNTEVTI